MRSLFLIVTRLLIGRKTLNFPVKHALMHKSRNDLENDSPLHRIIVKKRCNEDVMTSKHYESCTEICSAQEANLKSFSY